MSENNINLEAKDQPSEATTYGGLLRIARENKELSIDQEIGRASCRERV